MILDSENVTSCLILQSFSMANSQPHGRGRLLEVGGSDLESQRGETLIPHVSERRQISVSNTGNVANQFIRLIFHLASPFRTMRTHSFPPNNPFAGVIVGISMHASRFMKAIHGKVTGKIQEESQAIST
jgi:hypothetical protein